jgi:hypothetical protein
MNDLSEEQKELLYHYIFTGHSLNDVDWLSARSSLFPDVLRAIINSYGISRTQTNILQNIMDGLDLSEYVGNTFTDWSSYENINEEEKESSCLSPSSLSCQKYITLTRELYDKNNECSICLTDFDKDDFVTITKCRHVFHNDCIIEWIENKNEEKLESTCPNCRLKLENY